MLKYATEESAGIDLPTTASFILDPGERALVPTGVYVSDLLPQPLSAPHMTNAGWSPIYVIQICPRSGLALKTGVTVLNSPGVVDSDYTEEIKVILINHGAEPVQFDAGDRVAQAVVGLALQMEHIPKGGKRDGGFMSTGK